MAKQQHNQPDSGSEIILYQTEDGRNRIEVRLENETVWLTQQLMAELFQTPESQEVTRISKTWGGNRGGRDMSVRVCVKVRKKYP